MITREALEQELSRLHDRFSKLGSWTYEKGIDDYPALGGPYVPANRVFEDVARTSILFGERQMPDMILEAMENLKKFGYDDFVFLSFLNYCDIKIGYGKDGLSHIAEAHELSKRCKTKEEFQEKMIALNHDQMERVRQKYSKK